MGIWLSKSFQYLRDDLAIENTPRQNAMNIEGELREMKNKYEVLEQRMSALQTSVTDKVDQINGLLKSVTERVEEISTQQKSMKGEQTSMTDKADDLEEKLESLLLERRKLFMANTKEQTTDVKPVVGNEKQEGGDQGGGDAGAETPTCESYDILKKNYVKLKNEISVSVAEVVSYLFQEGVVSLPVKEEIMSEHRNRFTRATQILDIVLLKISGDTKAYEIFYEAVKASQLWDSADTLYPENKPHFQEVIVEEEKETKEETAVKDQVQVNLQEQAAQIGTLNVPEVVKPDLKPDFENTDLLQQFESLMSHFFTRSLQAINNEESNTTGIKTEGKQDKRYEDFSEQLEDLQTKVDGLSTSSPQDLGLKAAFVVELRAGTEVTTGVKTRLDHVSKIWDQTGDFFDREMALFNVPYNGTYHFNITMWQTGPGRLEVSLGTSPNAYRVTSTYINGEWSNMTHDVRSGSLTLTLSKGQQLSVYVVRLEGEAMVQFCRYSGCLVSSSP